MGYINPVLKLPAAQKLAALPLEQRLAIAAVFRELRGVADDLAESSWSRRKGPMASYWRGVATYSRHLAHALERPDLKKNTASKHDAERETPQSA
ncbi:hypothetical protein [Ralstonia solanacearum]|uniref:hypothetical protein n=1 Tax=Ralstonia solanacearum TaxID=305 RepID=UPI0012D454CD|nr:hypothetical protein [Ralstonia solanacearum]MDC6180062.1 hypothetical protein [Ralstonia solanacearum]MDC6241446.1 hypothetical protein [Ralstonia solanacearum]